jgi:alkylation response protein AidB-like acyl-CoA dehydrogenase
MELELSETQNTIRAAIRDYLVRELDPLVPQLEDGSLLPFEPLRKMAAALGLNGPDDELARMMKEAAPEEMLPFFVPRILSVELSRVCAGVALAHGASIGLCGGDIRAKGTPEQKERWGAPIARLEKIGCWALTEPQAGSAAIRDMKSTALRDGDHFVLNGSKTFISNAPVADIFVVYAKLRENGTETPRAFVLERGDPGLSTGKPFKKMGFKSSPTGEVFLSDCRVPADRMLGGARPAGSGSKNVKQRLSRERVGLVAISYGIAERAFDIALDYARTRVQGGQVIGNYQLVQRRLTRMYMALANARSFVFADIRAKRRLDQSVVDASVGKLYVAEVATFVAQEAMHILAGNGYMEEYVIERLYRDAKLIELGGGTTEIQEITAGRWLMENYGR